MQLIADIRAQGVTVTQHTSTGRFAWAMSLEHPKWGKAQLIHTPDTPLPAQSLLRQSVGLTPYELEQACERRSLVVISMKTNNQPLLPATKQWLRWGLIAAGSTGTCLIDHHSERLWSIAALQSELSHDAPLDISALYAVRMYVDDDEALRWIHTHGLGIRGGFDLDIFEPSADMLGIQGHEILRALAFKVLEGTLSPSTRRVKLLGAPHGQLVPFETFTSKAPVDLQHLWSTAPEPGRRAVLIDPVSRITTRGDVVYRPYSVTSAPLQDVVVDFSTTATTLMRERAQATWPWLLQLLTTLSEFPDKLADSLQWECFIKVGIRTGSRLAFTTEHLWFRMLEHTEHQITAVLISEPEGASRLRSGAIATYGAADISGWMVRTRLGTIMPHDDRVARMLFELSATR